MAVVSVTAWNVGIYKTDTPADEQMFFYQFDLCHEEAFCDFFPLSLSLAVTQTPAAVWSFMKQRKKKGPGGSIPYFQNNHPWPRFILRAPLQIAWASLIIVSVDMT